MFVFEVVVGVRLYSVSVAVCLSGPLGEQTTLLHNSAVKASNYYLD